MRILSQDYAKLVDNPDLIYVDGAFVMFQKGNIIGILGEFNTQEEALVNVFDIASSITTYPTRPIYFMPSKRLLK